MPRSDFTYRFFSLATGAPIADLPLEDAVPFGQALNTPGSSSGLKVTLSDPRVLKLPVLDATDPWLAAMGIIYQGILVWAGLVAKRSYKIDPSTAAEQSITFDVTELGAWFRRRLQAHGYGQVWATTPIGSMAIARQVVADAQAVGTILGGFSITTTNTLGNGPTGAETTQEPSADWITATYPMTQMQSLDAILSGLSQQAYGIGFDYDIAPSLDVNGHLFATLEMFYPVAGRRAALNGLHIDVGMVDTFEYVEDGTNQADRIVGTSSGTGGIKADLSWPPALAAGYPLLEATESFTSINCKGQLTNVTQGVLATNAYGVVTAVVIMPVGGRGGLPKLGGWKVGDCFTISMSKSLGGIGEEAINPRFPNGLNIEMRCVSWDVSVPPGAGYPVATLNFVMPASSTPVPPPIR